MAFAGGDLNLTGTKYWNVDSSEDDTCFVLRRAAHNTLYALANSNAVNQKIVGYKLPVWRVLVYSGEGALAGLFLIWGFFAIFTAIRSKDKGKKSKKAAAAAEGENLEVKEAEPAEKAEE